MRATTCANRSSCLEKTRVNYRGGYRSRAQSSQPEIGPAGSVVSVLTAIAPTTHPPGRENLRLQGRRRRGVERIQVRQPALFSLLEIAKAAGWPQRPQLDWPTSDLWIILTVAAG